MSCSHTMEYYFEVKSNNIHILAILWKSFEKLSDGRQSQKATSYMIPCDMKCPESTNTWRQSDCQEHGDRDQGRRLLMDTGFILKG